MKAQRRVCYEVKQKADYISSVNGGQGVIQDVFRWLLGNLGEWDGFVYEKIAEGY